ncbi:hypothetical protein [Paraburkholderia caffeinilytica]|uniref:hypothetical protein n=1 Tax=Paraburkholderia caffeinilytica TaxID=1761016 RepID=UPI003DA06E97
MLATLDDNGEFVAECAIIPHTIWPSPKQGLISHPLPLSDADRGDARQAQLHDLGLA